MARDSTLDGEFPSELGGGTTTSTGGGGGDVKAIPNRLTSKVAERLVDYGPYESGFGNERVGGAFLYNNQPWGGTRSGVYIGDIAFKNSANSSNTNTNASYAKASVTLPSTTRGFPAITQFFFTVGNPTGQAQFNIEIQAKPTDKRFSYYQHYLFENFSFRTDTYPRIGYREEASVTTGASYFSTVYRPGIFGFEVGSKPNAGVFGNYGAGADISVILQANRPFGSFNIFLYGAHAYMNPAQTLAASGYTQTP